MSPNQKQIALNTHLLLPIALGVLFVLLSVVCARTQDVGLSVGFGLATLLPVFGFLISPMYYVFSKDGVEIVYLLGQREVIRWRTVKEIILMGDWFIRNMEAPHYHFVYPHKGKQAFFVCGDISKTRRTKRLIKRYYRKEIL